VILTGRKLESDNECHNRLHESSSIAKRGLSLRRIRLTEKTFLNKQNITRFTRGSGVMTRSSAAEMLRHFRRFFCHRLRAALQHVINLSHWACRGLPIAQRRQQ
jgi:hypothetical protein